MLYDICFTIYATCHATYTVLLHDLPYYCTDVATTRARHVLGVNMFSFQALYDFAMSGKCHLWYLTLRYTLQCADLNATVSQAIHPADAGAGGGAGGEGRT